MRSRLGSDCFRSNGFRDLSDAWAGLKRDMRGGLSSPCDFPVARLVIGVFLANLAGTQVPIFDRLLILYPVAELIVFSIIGLATLPAFAQT